MCVRGPSHLVAATSNSQAPGAPAGGRPGMGRRAAIRRMTIAARGVLLTLRLTAGGAKRVDFGVGLGRFT